MKRFLPKISRHAFVGFFLLAYLWSWSWWSLVLFGVWIGAQQWQGPAYHNVPYWMMGAALIGGWGPTLSALVITAGIDGSKGLRNILRRSFNWRFPVQWYFVAGLLPPAMMGAGLLLFYGTAHHVGHFALWRWRTALLLLFINLFAGPLGEEIGWRGFLLPRMEPLFGSLKSSLVIGMVWCIWHTPLFWAPMGTTISGTFVTTWAVTKYLIYVLGLSVLFTWIFDRTRLSVIPTMIMHLAINADLVTPFFPDLAAGDIRTIRELSTIPIWIFVVVLVVCRRIDRASQPSFMKARTAHPVAPG